MSEQKKRTTKGKESLPGGAAGSLRERATRVVLTDDHPENAYAPDSASSYRSIGVDSTFDMDLFKKSFKIDLVSSTKEQLVFDLIGVDTAVANAFRRILLGEVPTVAIETVFMENNTSVVPDEVLAHRVGLVPLNVDPHDFEMRTPEMVAAGSMSDTDTLEFELRVKCTVGRDGKPVNDRVLSGDLVWKPAGDQEDRFAASGKPKPAPVEPGIVLAKMRPGQEIAFTCFAHKGIGKDHAKFSPVATASYRLMPEIVVADPAPKGAAAKTIKQTCAMGVFDIEDDALVVKSPRNCTMCRNCIAGELQQYLRLTRVRDHFIFSIETTGALSPKTLFVDAVNVLMSKCDTLLMQLAELGRMDDEAKAEEAAAAEEGEGEDEPEPMEQ
eukprot:m51a1_g5680 putative rna polymerase iii subunit (384) ;mRNA; r:969018-970369